jgi:hypothetical protein
VNAKEKVPTMNKMAITCLIPAFKIQYVMTLFRSLANQKIKPVRIIVSDDTPNNDFLKWIEEKKLELSEWINVESYEGPKEGHYKNIEFLISLYQKKPTTHFHVFHDDDLIFPDFYYQHLKALEQNQAICQVSRRWISEESGIPLSADDIPKEILNLGQHSIEISKDLVATSYIRSGVNWLGELSFAVFDNSFLNHSDQFHYFENIPLSGLNDIGSFLKASLVGKLVFLDHYLGTMRRTQSSLTGTKGYTFSLAILAKINFAILAIQHNALSAAGLKHAVQETIRFWHHYYGENWVLDRLRLFRSMLEQEQVNAFYSEFRDFHNNYYRGLNELATCRDRDQLIQGLQADLQ